MAKRAISRMPVQRSRQETESSLNIKTLAVAEKVQVHCDFTLV